MCPHNRQACAAANTTHPRACRHRLAQPQPAGACKPISKRSTLLAALHLDLPPAPAKPALELWVAQRLMARASSSGEAGGSGASSGSGGCAPVAAVVAGPAALHRKSGEGAATSSSGAAAPPGPCPAGRPHVPASMQALLDTGGRAAVASLKALSSSQHKRTSSGGGATEAQPGCGSREAALGAVRDQQMVALESTMQVRRCA